MFEGKTLIGVGCSHTFAPLGEDINPLSCHERSWVKKLENIGNFKNSINLSLEGASNQRSERVLMEYLETHEVSNLVIAFGLTDVSRFEIPLPDQTFTHLYTMKPFGPWSVNKEFTSDPKEITFMEILYGKFHSTQYETVMINRTLLFLNTFLNKFNIEHYFIELHCHGGSIVDNPFGIKLPLLNFKNKYGDATNAICYIMEQGYVPDYTGHFDHDAHQFLAELFYNRIKEMKNV